MQALSAFQSEHKIQNSKPKIGGLLYLVAIYLTSDVVFEITSTFQHILYIEDFESLTWFLKSFFSAPSVFSILLLALAFIGLIKEKRTFPYFFIAYLIYKICNYIGIFIIVKYLIQTEELAINLSYLSSILVAFTLIFYIIFSKRAKNTFVN